MTITRTFADKITGSAYVMNFGSAEEAEVYSAPDDREEVPNRPGDNFDWRDGQWVERVASAAIATISKDAIWRRATDEEAEQMEAALQAQPVRLRRIYEGATFISTSDELYAVLEGALVQLFGVERAAELLEPTG